MERFEAFKVKWDITFYTEIRCFGIFLAIFTAICVIPSLLTFCSRSRLNSHLLPRSKRPCGGGLLKPLFYPAQPMKILLTPDIPYPRRCLIQEDLGWESNAGKGPGGHNVYHSGGTLQACRWRSMGPGWYPGASSWRTPARERFWGPATSTLHSPVVAHQTPGEDA